jgi:DNA-binding MarR family transcriptional regulator
MTNVSELIEKIFTLSRAMKGTMSYSSDLTHLSLLQLQTLIFIQKTQRAQMRDIAGHFKIEMPTASDLIAKLVKQKLVNRTTDSKDKRLVRITLTSQGQQLLQDAMKERNKKLSHILSYLSEKNKEDLLAIISVLIAKMEEANEK